MANIKTKEEYLQEALTEELLEELRLRRGRVISHCSDQEIEAELAARGLDRLPPQGGFPKLVEK